MPSWKELNEKAKEKAKEWVGKARERREERRNRPVGKLLNMLTTEEIRHEIHDAECTDNPVRKIEKLQAAGASVELKHNFVKASAGRIVEQRSRGAYFKFIGKAYAASLAAMVIPIMIFVPPVILLPVVALSVALQPLVLLSAALLLAPAATLLTAKVLFSRIADKEHLKQSILLAEQNPRLNNFGGALSILEDYVSRRLEETQKTCDLAEAFNSLSSVPAQRKMFLAENQILHERLKDDGLIVPKKPKEHTPIFPGLWKQA